MIEKRITIYDIAREVGFSPSYVSKALNNYPLINPKIRELIKKKADELNYKQNSQASNLRRGTTRTLGVIVPKINQLFFSDAIAGMEEVCFENNHNLIICQSHESFKREALAINTLIQQNVDCIIISVCAETQSDECLSEIVNNKIPLIQFDRYLDSIDSYKVINDNREASFRATRHLIEQGYSRIAFLGGPEQISIFKERKKGFIDAIKESRLPIPYNFITENQLSKEAAVETSRELLQLEEPPDAFFTVADFLSVGVLEVAGDLNIKIPQEVGIIGFANEAVTRLARPSLSSVDQRSGTMGRCAAQLYFDRILKEAEGTNGDKTTVIKSEIVIRESSAKS